MVVDNLDEEPTEGTLIKLRRHVVPLIRADDLGDLIGDAEVTDAGLKIDDRFRGKAGDGGRATCSMSPISHVCTSDWSRLRSRMPYRAQAGSWSTTTTGSRAQVGHDSASSLPCRSTRANLGDAQHTDPAGPETRIRAKPARPDSRSTSEEIAMTESMVAPTVAAGLILSLESRVTPSAGRRRRPVGLGERLVREARPVSRCVGPPS